ncbi:hypothetical protein [Sinomicrobium pectinilyticum]|uniref:hypothetical protein n=1 Tax=Sinomicrobium pectinilyticum TaxID=1084421 RepID=UPI0014729643|nr:hypothetical protein [Sinomicrobium pectinilyticum]
MRKENNMENKVRNCPVEVPYRGIAGGMVTASEEINIKGQVTDDRRPGMHPPSVFRSK